jgi:hypothetical protein
MPADGTSTAFDPALSKAVPGSLTLTITQSNDGCTTFLWQQSPK